MDVGVRHWFCPNSRAGDTFLRTKFNESYNEEKIQISSIVHQNTSTTKTKLVE